MRPDDVLDFVRRRPFQPYRFTTTGGETFEVRHPEMAIVGRSALAVGVPPSDEISVHNRIVTIALVHIVKLELLSGHGPDSQNGQNS
jgi:hypothetical protein